MNLRIVALVFQFITCYLHGVYIYIYILHAVQLCSKSLLVTSLKKTKPAPVLNKD